MSFVFQMENLYNKVMCIRCINIFYDVIYTGVGPMNIFCSPANVITTIEKDSLGDEFVLVDIDSCEMNPVPKNRSSSMLAPSRKSTSESGKGKA